MVRIGIVNLALIPRDEHISQILAAIVLISCCVYLNSMYLFIFFVLTMSFHEFGHYIACRYFKVPVLEIMISPTYGHVGHLNSNSDRKKLYISLMGPIIGTIPYIVSVISGYPKRDIVQVLTIVCFYVNIYQLVPKYYEGRVQKSDGAVVLEILAERLDISNIPEHYSNRYSWFFSLLLVLIVYLPYII